MSGLTYIPSIPEMDKAFPNNKWDALASFYYPDDILGISVQINGEWHGEKCNLETLPQAIERIKANG